MTLEGAKVLACVELMPYSSGLQRNIVQCLEDFDIPLYLSHTVTKIHGDRRVTGVTIQKVDEQKNPIPGTEMDFECDTLLLSVGLIPENELTKGAGIRIDPRTNGPEVYDNLETSAEGIFACGNVVHVHDLVDYVSEESARAGAGAARRIAGNPPEASGISVEAGNAVSYVVPQHIRNSEDEKTVPLFFRVRRMLKKVRIEISDRKNLLASYPREYIRVKWRNCFCRESFCKTARELWSPSGNNLFGSGAFLPTPLKKQEELTHEKADLHYLSKRLSFGN